MTGDAVAALRAAAAAGDWELARDAVARALDSMACAQARALAEEVLTARLPLLERAHPSDNWARRTLDGEDAGPPGNYPGPGANSLVKGIQHLMSARATDDPDRCRSHVVDAIAEAVMAVLVATWGARHPSEWADWYARAMRPGAAESLVLIDVRVEPNMRELERAQWSSVAERLASR